MPDSDRRNLSCIQEEEEEEESDLSPSGNLIAHRREVVPPAVPQWDNFDVDIFLVRAVFASNWRAQGVTCIALLLAMLYRNLTRHFLRYEAFMTESLLQWASIQWICVVNFEEFIALLITVAALYMYYRHHPDEIRNRRLGPKRSNRRLGPRRRSVMILYRMAGTVPGTLGTPSHSHGVQQIPFAMNRGHGYGSNFASGTEGQFSSIPHSQGYTQSYRFRMRRDERNVPRSLNEISFRSVTENFPTIAQRFQRFGQPETPVRLSEGTSTEAFHQGSGSASNIQVDNRRLGSPSLPNVPSSGMTQDLPSPRRASQPIGDIPDSPGYTQSHRFRMRRDERNVPRSLNEISLRSVTENFPTIAQRFHRFGQPETPVRLSERTSTEAFHQGTGSASNILVDNRRLGSPSLPNVPSSGMMQDLPSPRRASQPIGDIPDSQGYAQSDRFRMRRDERNVPRSLNEISFRSVTENFPTTTQRFYRNGRPVHLVRLSESFRERVSDMEFALLPDVVPDAVLHYFFRDTFYILRNSRGSSNPGRRENVNVDDNPEHREGHSSAKAVNKDPNVSVAMNPERREGQSATHRADQFSESSSTVRERTRYAGERNRSYSNFSSDSSAMITRNLIALQSQTTDEISQNEHQILSLNQNDGSEARTSTEAFRQGTGSASNILVDNRSPGSPSLPNVPSPSSGMMRDLPGHRRASQPIGDIEQNVNQNSAERYDPQSSTAHEERLNRLREEVRCLRAFASALRENLSTSEYCSESSSESSTEDGDTEH